MRGTGESTQVGGLLSLVPADPGRPDGGPGDPGRDEDQPDREQEERRGPLVAAPAWSTRDDHGAVGSRAATARASTVMTGR